MVTEVGLMAAEATGAIQGTALEISVSKAELLRELTATQGVVERKTTIPILSNFLFDNRCLALCIVARISIHIPYFFCFYSSACRRGLLEKENQIFWLVLSLLFHLEFVDDLVDLECIPGGSSIGYCTE